MTTDGEPMDLVPMPENAISVSNEDGGGNLGLTVTQNWRDEAGLAVRSGLDHCVVKGNLTFGSSEDVEGECIEGSTGLLVVVYLDDYFDPDDCEACNVDDIADMGGNHEFCAYVVEIPCEPVSVECGEPTSEPSDSPTKAPTGSQCPEDLELVGQKGKTDIDLDRVVKIVSQDTSTVKVSLTQGWDQLGDEDIPIDHLFYSYRPDHFDEKCYEETSVVEGTNFDTVTIQCHVYKPYAIIEICVVDDLKNELLTVEDDATVPQCCYPTFPPETPTVCYTIKINCVTECVEEDENDDEEVVVRAPELRGSN